MKTFAEVAKEFASTNAKQNRRALQREKELYAFWRNKKIRSVEEARHCKQRGWSDLQLRYQHEAAKYNQWALESKARIREIGKWIYG